jgi:hypothetical protein
MDKSKAATLLFIGGFLIYLGLFGTSGFGMKMLALTTGFTDNFDDNNIDASKWNIITTAGGSVTETNRHAKFVGDGAGAWHGGEYASVNQYTVTDATLSVDVVYTGPTYGAATLMLYNERPAIPITSGSNWWEFAFENENGHPKIAVVKSPSDWKVNWNAVVSPTGTLKITVKSNVISFFYGPIGSAGNLIWSGAYALPSLDCYVTIGGYDQVGEAGQNGVELDNFALTLGGVNPTYSDVTISIPSGHGTTTPSAGTYSNTFVQGGSFTITALPESNYGFDYLIRAPDATHLTSLTISNLAATESISVYFKYTGGSSTTGILNILASKDSAWVVATNVMVTGAKTYGPYSTTGSAAPYAVSVDIGIYTVSGIYNGVTKTATASVTASGGTATLDFGGGQPFPDILKVILDTINSTAVRTLLTMIGVAVTGIGGIGLLTGRRSTPQTPQPREPRDYYSH